ncbi:MAG: hypothetical protein ACMXYK_00815 [Candidatus Woesearchaeota archaeon]
MEHLTPYRKQWSLEELKDISITTFFLSLIFGFLLFRGGVGVGLESFLYSMFIAFVAVGISFIGHELAHKLLAIHYKCLTQFKTDIKMLLVGLFMAIFMPFIFIVPGGVIITNVRKKEYMGKIALAGPLVNMVFAGLFWLLLQVHTHMLFEYGIFINSWLAFFNMLPFGGFDGKKVLDWDRNIYFVAMGISAVLFLMHYF